LQQGESIAYVKGAVMVDTLERPTAVAVRASEQRLKLTRHDSAIWDFKVDDLYSRDRAADSTQLRDGTCVAHYTHEVLYGRSCSFVSRNRGFRPDVLSPRGGRLWLQLGESDGAVDR
jgi:hypothetical protein